MRAYLSLYYQRQKFYVYVYLLYLNILDYYRSTHNTHRYLLPLILLNAKYFNVKGSNKY